MNSRVIADSKTDESLSGSDEARTIERRCEASILAALNDPDSRAILEVTGGAPVSATEIMESCGLSSSTAYRKLNSLVEMGLLEVETITSASGNRSRMFSHSLRTVNISLNENQIELKVTVEE